MALPRDNPAYVPLAASQPWNSNIPHSNSNFGLSVCRAPDSCVQLAQKLYAERSDLRHCRYSDLALNLQKLDAVTAEAGPVNRQRLLTFW